MQQFTGGRTYGSFHLHTDSGNLNGHMDPVRRESEVRVIIYQTERLQRLINAMNDSCLGPGK